MIADIEYIVCKKKHWSLSVLQATKYKAAVLPVAGAVLGTVLAGPVGLVAGAKIGGLLGVAGGGMAGLYHLNY